MAQLYLDLLGGFSARLDGGRACVLPTRKAEALLAYLAMPAGRFHSRDKLATLLWGETSEMQARQSFRQALATLRRALGAGEPPALVTRGDTVALNPEAVAVDVAALEAALVDASPGALAQATTLYKGDFLDGHRVDEMPFEEWRVVERARLRELVLAGLTRLLREQRDAEQLEPAIRTAQRIVALDPLREAAHRTLMRLLLRQGRRAAALHQYQVCVTCLERELGAAPEERTRQVYREILRAAATPDRAASASATATAPDGTTTGARPASPLVGRAAELERMRKALAGMLDGGGRIVLVSGEAGIGKSRLIQELSSEVTAHGMRVVLGRCHETEQGLPLHPWLDALRGDRPALDVAVRDRLGAAASAQLARVFPELGEDASVAPGAQHTLLFDALAQLIGELVAAQPIVMIIEDVHWADAMSARFLAFLGRRIHRLPILVVASVRPEELVDAPVLMQALNELRGEGRLDEIALRSLSEDESRTLVRTLHPGARKGEDGERIAGQIWVASEGNPFVIVESVQALHDAPVETWTGPARLARGVQEFVAARLERLGPLPRRAVAVAAVIGRDFPFGLLVRASGLGERAAAEAVEELVRRRILDAVGDQLAFCHDWIRQVAYDRVLPATRGALHAAIGEALEALNQHRLDDVADQLRHHFSAGGETRKAIAYLVRVAELAARRYALDDAVAALQQAMIRADFLPADERDRCRLDVALRQAFALSLLGRHRERLQLLGAHAGYLKRADDPALASDYYFRLALTHIYFCEHAHSQLAGEQALREGERERDPERIGKALHVLSLNAYGIGEPRQGLAYGTRALPLLDRAATQHYLALVYNDLALNALAAGTLDAAVDAAERGVAIGSATRDPRLEAQIGYVIAWVHALRGDCDVAIEAARRCVDISPDRLSANLATCTLGFAYLEGGDAASAIPALEQAAAELGRFPVRYGERRALTFLSEAYLLAGDADRARETALRAHELSRLDAMPYNVGLAERALGRIAHAEAGFEEAERRLSGALETFTTCAATFEAARTRVDLARLCARRRAVEAARMHLAAALSVFSAANAPKREAAARAVARSLQIALVEA